MIGTFLWDVLVTWCGIFYGTDGTGAAAAGHTTRDDRKQSGTFDITTATS